MRMTHDIAAKGQKKQNKYRAKEEKEKFRARSIALKELNARKGKDSSTSSTLGSMASTIIFPCIKTSVQSDSTQAVFDIPMTPCRLKRVRLIV